jgi:hypothetical protein
MKNQVYFHGDVNFEEVSEVPKDAKKIKIYEGFIVEKGEGVHTHTLKRMDNKKTAFIDDEVEAFVKDNTIYFNIKQPGVVGIDHEEHKTKPFTPKIIKKSIEREYDANSDSERKVRD